METMANVTHQKTVLAALKNGPLSIEKLAEKTGLSHRQVTITCNILKKKGRIGNWRPLDERSCETMDLLRDNPSLPTSELASRLREGESQRGALGSGVVEIPTRAVYDFLKALKRAGLVTGETRQSAEPKLFIPRMQSVVHSGNYRALTVLRKVAAKHARERGLRQMDQIPEGDKKLLITEYEKAFDALMAEAAPCDREQIAQLKFQLLRTLRGTTFMDVLLLGAVRLFYPSVVQWYWLPTEAVCDLQGNPMKAPRLRVIAKTGLAVPPSPVPKPPEQAHLVPALQAA